MKTSRKPTTQSNKPLSAAQALVNALRACNVSTIFGYPGNYILPLFDALYDAHEIDVVVTRHEQGAVHAADGYARTSGRVGVVVTTSGPGATNAVTGIATAYADSIPLVILTGQVPTCLIGTDAFQESDTFGITLPIVKHSYLMRQNDDLVKVIHDAFHIASSGRPGPVLIDIPFDILQQPYMSQNETDCSLSDAAHVAIDDDAITQAVSMITKATSPLIICGGGCVVSHAEHEICSLVENKSIPFLVTLMAKGILPEDHPLSYGFVGKYASDQARQALHNADLIIAVGVRFSNRIIHEGDYSFDTTDIIHIDIDPAELGKIYRSSCSIAGDARDILHIINDRLGNVSTQDCSITSESFQRARSPHNNNQAHSDKTDDVIKDTIQDLSSNLIDSTNTVSIPQALSFLSKCLDPDNSIVLTDVGQHQIWAALYIYRSLPHTFITPGGLGTMGFGLPAAIGASLARSDKTIICITGDGSFQMNIQEMITARSCGASIKVVMLNNSALGMVRSMQKQSYGKRYIATDFDNNPDFCELASAYGWGYGKAETQKDAEYEIVCMLEHEGNYLLELVVDKEQDIEVLRP